MSVKRKGFYFALMMGMLSVSTASAAEWRQKKEYRDDFGASVEIQATYYAAEYVERSTQDQAQKNLWTADEAEDYRYNLLQQLKLDDTIPVFIKFTNRGPAIRMAPFESQVTLTVGKHRHCSNARDHDGKETFGYNRHDYRRQRC